MTAKEYLQQYGDAEIIAQRLKSQYEKEVDFLDLIRSPLGGDGQPRGRSGSNPIEAKAVRLAEKLTEYQEAEFEAMLIKHKILKTVNKVPAPVGSVLYERYINLRSWREVAETLHYSERHCHNLHEKGLDIVEDLIK